MKRSWTWGAVVAAAGLVAIQFVPVERTNAVGVGHPDAPPDVQWILRRACYDCHSMESRWPIWAYVAPMSWMVVRDVERARAVVDFSNWAAYDPVLRAGLRAMVGPVTASHRMPVWYYLTLHPDARLSEQDLAALEAWSRGAFPEAGSAVRRTSTGSSDVD